MRKAVLLFFAGALWGLAAATEACGGVEVTTCQYAKKGKDTLYLDIYIDPAVKVEGKRPVVIFSFGGGWESGDRKQGAASFISFLPNLAKQGYVAVGIDYRLSFLKARKAGLTPDKPLGETIQQGHLADKDVITHVLAAIKDGVEDLYDATSFIIENAGKWNIDTGQIVISGGSAGAINSCMAEYWICNDDGLAKEHLPAGFNYAGVVACAGGIWKYGTEAPAWKKNPCPMLLFHGTKDWVVPYTEALHPEVNAGLFGPDAISRSLDKINAPYWIFTGIANDHIMSVLPLVTNQNDIKTFLKRFVTDKEQIALRTTETSLAAPEAENISVKVTKKYLNLPVSHRVSRSEMTFEVDGKPERTFGIRLAPDSADYWVFCDVSALKGKDLKILYDGTGAGLRHIYQADGIAGQDSLYTEINRPQLHFTPKRGWHNDPNGLIYYEGEYHLFFQHNPYEREWGNMHWGHAVSKDLVHWEELPVALYPDGHGTVFSGSVVIDYENTAGFNRGTTPAMIAVYTADGPRQVQCIAYSLDRGRTWTKYEGNPVIDSGEKWNSRDTRDPRVFRYAPNREWVMVLNERDGHSIYTSANLKDWKYESHTTGFWECPDLFELPVDGDHNNRKWVMYGASGAYMTGTFDGRTFTPEAGKYYYTTGSLYAAQTYANMPASDSRRIQTGWGRIAHPGMPFNSLMLLPTELTLRTTKDGIRLFSYPVKEVEQLQTPVLQRTALQAKDADSLLRPYRDADCLRIQFTVKLSHATDAGLNLHGRQLMRYDLNSNTVNGVFYSPADMTSMEISADIIIDKTSVEVFIDRGAYSYSMERKAGDDNREGFHFWGNNIEIKDLNVYLMNSIWK